MAWLAVDGEAIEDKYCLLCDDTGRHVLNLDGLSTKECFEFLLSSRAKVGSCFGLNYDANNWLKDLPEPRLRELWDTGECHTRSYFIEWIPGKWFRIKDTNKREIKICEVWGFFQSSFVKACAAWSIEVQKELETMKQKRGTFSTAELQRIISYCKRECELLSELMGKIENQCDRLEIRPKNWIGAGSLASALLSKENIAPHHVHDKDLTSSISALEAVMTAYFGGRVEMFRQGVTKVAYTFDINSAYPAGIKMLPSMENASVRHVRRYLPDEPHAVWRVKWENVRGLVMPFPVRVKKEIFYPRSGEGCYHAIEVRQAIEAGYPIEVIEGWVLRVRNSTDPFAWVQSVYSERRKLKKEKDHGEKVLKLALNSVYGKLAQGQGFKGNLPPFQCYWWAGEVTAYTRARMLKIAQLATPLMISTDGVFLDKKVRAGRVSENLGDLTYEEKIDLFVGQPGVYHGYSTDGTEILRSRGFFARDIDYADLREGYEKEGNEYIHQYTSKGRFIGLGVSLQKKSLEDWRKWVDQTRAISLGPRRKVIGEDGSLSPIPGPLVSEVYIPKRGKGETEDHAQGMDQPLKNERE